MIAVVGVLKAIVVTTLQCNYRSSCKSDSCMISVLYSKLKSILLTLVPVSVFDNNT